MAWTQLTLIDEKERRVNTVSGINWIFNIVSHDPSTIDDFIRIDEEFSGLPSTMRHAITEQEREQYLDFVEQFRKIRPSIYFHELEKLIRRQNDNIFSKVRRLLYERWIPADAYPADRIIDTLPVSYPAEMDVGTEQADDSGGTIIVDFPKKIVTVKAHSEREMPENTRDNSMYKLTQKGLVKTETGEPCYERYGLISELRDNTAGYSLNVATVVKPKHIFGGNLRINQNVPESPTKDNPVVALVYRDDMDFAHCVASVVKEWDVHYKVPDSWTIRDGIKHIDY